MFREFSCFLLYSFMGTAGSYAKILIKRETAIFSGSHNFNYHIMDLIMATVQLIDFH